MTEEEKLQILRSMKPNDTDTDTADTDTKNLDTDADTVDTDTVDTDALNLKEAQAVADTLMISITIEEMLYLVYTRKMHYKNASEKIKDILTKQLLKFLK